MGLACYRTTLSKSLPGKIQTKLQTNVCQEVLASYKVSKAWRGQELRRRKGKREIDTLYQFSLLSICPFSWGLLRGLKAEKNFCPCQEAVGSESRVQGLSRRKGLVYTQGVLWVLGENRTLGVRVTFLKSGLHKPWSFALKHLNIRCVMCWLLPAKELIQRLKLALQPFIWNSWLSITTTKHGRKWDYMIEN